MKKIQVYGPGCPNCQKLYDMAKQAVEELGLNIEIEKIEDLNAMLAAG
ncbi:MAG: thioredoxin family protein, partial [Caldisericaceae bacterium]|nr:thioredoxin family protein [Caldisericaceae bacterium]